MTASMLRRELFCGTDNGDVAVAANIVGKTFTNSPLGAWLVPDPEERPAVPRAALTIIIAHALDHGEIHFLTQSGPTGDEPGSGMGVAVWFHHEKPTPAPADHAGRLRQAAGANTRRSVILDDLFAEQHPPQRHHHLAFLASVMVTPAAGAELLDSGIGAELLRHHHKSLDCDLIPADTEAHPAGPQDVRARCRHRPHGTQVRVNADVVFTPMLRTPMGGAS
jgi:hypothetical protein